MSNRKNREGGQYIPSANDDMPVNEQLDQYAGAESEDAPLSAPTNHPLDDADDRPAYDRPGVGGRTSPRGVDDAYMTGGEREGSMASRPSPALEDVSASVVDADAEIEPATMTDREMYAESMKASLLDRGVEIERLRREVAASDGDVRAMLQMQLDRLASLQDEATRRLHDLSETGTNVWNEMAGSVDKAYSDLKTALESAWTKLSGK